MFFSSVLQSKAEEIDEGFAYCGRRHEAAQGAALHGTGTLAYVIKHKMAWWNYSYDTLTKLTGW